MPGQRKAAVLVLLGVSNHPEIYRRQISVDLDTMRKSKSFRFSVIFTDVSLSAKLVGLRYDKDFRQAVGRNGDDSPLFSCEGFPG